MKIYKQTVSKPLWSILNILMSMSEFDQFRLVGGTSLSLLLGHRMSVDIDLFTDAEYGSINFKEILKQLKLRFKYVETNLWSNEKTIGNSCFIGNSKKNMVKLDLFYIDPFVFPIVQVDNIRLSSLEEIAAMKLEVIASGGRKKDFWDIHELMNMFSIAEMLNFYEERNPYGFEIEELRIKLADFERADHDFDPKCLKGKYWQLIKLDIEEALK